MLFSVFLSCGGDDSMDNDDPVVNNEPAVFFEELVFNNKEAYFATDGSMSTPVDSASAKSIASVIDISFFYNFDYSEPGFMDPVTRSSDEWYWDQFYHPWLSNAVATEYFGTGLTKSQFDEAKADQSKIATLLEEDASAELAPHSIFPTGTCIGGRQSSDPQSIVLAEGQVFGFKNISTGKMGLLYIRTDQDGAWPIAVVSVNTRVDIIREQ